MGQDSSFDLQTPHHLTETFLELQTETLSRQPFSLPFPSEGSDQYVCLKVLLISFSSFSFPSKFLSRLTCVSAYASQRMQTNTTQRHIRVPFWKDYCGGNERMDWRSIGGSGKTREEVISKNQAKVSAACTRFTLSKQIPDFMRGFKFQFIPAYFWR